MDDAAEITRYLAGELSTAELQAFEIRLQADEAFAETVALFKAIDREMSETEDETELKEKLSGLTQKHFEVPGPAKIIPLNNRKRIWMYAVAAAAAIAIILFLIPGQKPLTNEQSYAQYAVPEELPTVVRGANDDSLLIRATTLFNRKMYAAAQILLDSITRLKPDEAQLRLSLGICFVQTGNFAGAIMVFDSVAVKETIYKYDAMAWKAYTYLKQNKTTECVAALKQIPADAPNYDRANTLISKLSRR